MHPPQATVRAIRPVHAGLAPTVPPALDQDDVEIDLVAAESAPIHCLVAVQAVTATTSDALVALAARRPTRFHLLVPAREVAGRDRRWLDHEYRSQPLEAPAFVLASHLLGHLMRLLDAAHVSRTGTVVEPDLFRAVRTYLAATPIDEVVVVGRRLRQGDLVRRLQDRVTVPVLRLDPMPAPSGGAVPLSTSIPLRRRWQRSSGTVW
jgi:hypothetical protein